MSDSLSELVEVYLVMKLLLYFAAQLLFISDDTTQCSKYGNLVFLDKIFGFFLFLMYKVHWSALVELCNTSFDFGLNSGLFMIYNDDSNTILNRYNFSNVLFLISTQYLISSWV